MIDIESRIEKAFQSMRAPAQKPVIGIILGSGLSNIGEAIENPYRVKTSDIDGFCASTAPSHAGEFLFGNYKDIPVVVQSGRVHLYEGYSAHDVAMQAWLMARLGVQVMIVNNAAGGLNPDYAPGSITMIRDHLNLTGHNPLVGIDAPAIGVRFPDMSRAYCPELRAIVHRTLPDPVAEGIYTGVTGPSLETSAERRYFASLGGDMVGMSTIMEVIAANHAGIRVLGFSIITNKATGGVDQKPDTLEDVLANAAIGATRLRGMLDLLIPAIGEYAQILRN